MSSSNHDVPAAEPLWPAPGLERLHGMLNGVRNRAALSATLVAVPFAWVLTGLPTYDPYVRRAIGWVVAIALFVFLSAILRLAGIVDLARKARRLGYSRKLILETITDRSRDTLALVSGTGTYLNVHDRTRARVRTLRLWSAFFSTAVAFVPLPLLCVALMLGMRGNADAIGFALIVFAPVITLMVAAALTSGYANVLAQWDRGGDAWDPSPVTEADRAAAWRASLQESTVPPHRGGLLSTLLTAISGIALFVGVAFVLTVTLVYALVIRDQVTRSLYMGATIGSGEALINVELMRDLRLPVDSTVPAEAARVSAGDALQALLESGRYVRDVTTTPPTWQKAPVRKYATSLWPSNLDQNRTVDYFAYVVRGRKSEMKALPPSFPRYDSIERMPPHPALQELTTLATARDIDVTSTRYTMPLSDTVVNHMDDFIFGGHAIDGAVMINAASRFEHGDRAGAELMLRRLLSAGFLLMDNSPYSRDFWVGSTWVGSARRALIALYNETGRKPEADALLRAYHANMRASIKSVARGSLGASMGTIVSTPDAGMRLNALLSTVHNREVFPSIRWSALAAGIPLAQCGSMRAAMFGPDEFTQLLINNARADAMRIPSDSALARALFARKGYQPFITSSRPGFRRLQRAFLAVIGPRQFRDACAGAFSPRF